MPPQNNQLTPDQAAAALAHSTHLQETVFGMKNQSQDIPSEDSNIESTEPVSQPENQLETAPAPTTSVTDQPPPIDMEAKYEQWAKDMEVKMKEDIKSAVETGLKDIKKTLQDLLNDK